MEGQDATIYAFTQCIPCKGSFILERKCHHFQWVHRESNLLFTFVNDEDQRKNSLSRLLSL